MHINLYASMTRELSNAEVDKLGGSERWGFTPSDPIGARSAIKFKEWQAGKKL
jgi:hypothetical protein